MGKVRWFGRMGSVAVVLVVSVAAQVLPASAQEAVRERAAETPEAGPPSQAIGERRNGQGAIDFLGERLPDVAARYKMTAGELRKTFLEDPTFFVDGGDELLYIDPAPHPASGASAPAATAPSSPNPLALHSRPDAPRVIYLDFDGETVTGTAWNATLAGAPFVAAPFTLDSDTSASFSATELATIEQIWQFVSEDFAPFDIDVTTADPGFDAISRTNLSDAAYGTRALIVGPGNASYSTLCPGGCGGVAYYDAFDRYDGDGSGTTHEYLQPALAFQDGLGGASASAKLIGEVISHEVGHNLYLHHDGRVASPPSAQEEYYEGHAPWAPIMGSGYDQPVTQWSSGEYARASNPEDDLAVMQANGAPLLGDDHGDDSVGATIIADNVSTAGLIEDAADLDVFRFEATGGLVTLAADPSSPAPNLDMSLTLRDSGGTPVATSSPATTFVSATSASGLGASIQQNLTAGTYYAYVEGVGQGADATTGYSDYASLGRYTIQAVNGVCATEDTNEPDDGQAQAKLLVAGEARSGTQCDDDWLLVPGIAGKTFTADLATIDADATIEFRSAASILATATSAGATAAHISAAFSGSGDHYVRVTGAGQTRYSLTTAMSPICPEDDPYEVPTNGDDFPSTATAMSLPGTKDAILCSDTNGDFAKVTLTAGREFEATVRYPAGSGSFNFYLYKDGHLEDTVTSGAGWVTSRYTPTASGEYYVWLNWTSGAVPYRLSVDPAAPPTITNISPTSGPVGSDVVITGTSLHTVSSVTFGGDVLATSFIASPTSITATVPAGATDGPLTVENPTGTASSSQTFTVVACPCASSPNESFNNQVPGFAIDGDPGTWWQPTAGPDPFGTDPKTTQVTLPALTELFSVHTQWFSEGYRFVDYTVEVSTNGTTWTPVASVTGNALADRTDVFTPTSARHLRITSTNWVSDPGAPYGPALRELTLNAP